MTEAPDLRVRYLRVTNNTDDMWTDAFDGVPVYIEPHRSQNIPLDMGAHFFGYHPDVKPEEMMRYIVRRRGLRDDKYLKHGDQRHDAQLAAEMFKELSIEPVTYKLVEERAAASRNGAEPVPALTDEDLTISEPTAVKDAAAAGMVDPSEEPPTPPYRGRGRPPAKPYGRRTEGE